MLQIRMSANRLQLLECEIPERPVVPPPVNHSFLQNTEHLGALLQSVAVSHFSEPAITTAAHQWTYGELLAAVREVADRLSTEPGFSPGDRVVLLLPNSPEYLIAFYGVLSAGGVVVPLPPAIEKDALRGVLATTDPVWIMTTAGVLKARSGLISESSEVLRTGTRASTVSPPEIDCGDSGPQPAAIFFTAGSTGTPKGVVLSHRNLISNARSIQQYLQIDRSECALCVLPFHHAFGNSVVQSHLLAGAQLVLAGQAMFPETLIRAIADYRCTSLSGVPDLFRVLLERTSLGQNPLPSLRYMAVAGGALPLELAVSAGRRIAPAKFFVMYGQTEATARLAFLPPEDLDSVQPGCIGRPVPGVTLQVVDDSGEPVAAGVIGELRARGENVMLGYWRDPAATTERIRSGWLYTHDLALTDETGRFVLQGRRSSLVKIAGFRVQPSDLEEFAVRRLSAAQAVAVACETRDRGTRLALFIRPLSGEAGLSAAEAVARCRAELPRHFVPDLIQQVSEFPLNHALKTDRLVLTRVAEEQISRRYQAETCSS